MACDGFIDGGALIKALSEGRSVCWINARRDALVAPEQRSAVEAARARLRRFAPWLARLFPELSASHGVIQSPLLPAHRLAAALCANGAPPALWIKADHQLPVGGSIKARGGTNAVLEIAERVLSARGGWDLDQLAAVDLAEARRLFADHTVAVGSTGNLGLSIGTLSAALGFRALVHMSSQAKPWKVARLRAQGVTVVVHEGDYLDALASGRRDSGDASNHHFIDDEDSEALLYGYATAAAELQQQLASAGRVVDERHPLFVHVPCGVGGAPTGIALGLAATFGPAAHCFYAEPTEAPCMLLALATGDAARSVYDLGLSGRTVADGLAVPRASRLAAALSQHVAAGVATLADAQMLAYVKQAHQAMQLRLEPSAAAGFHGAIALAGALGQRFLDAQPTRVRLSDVTHVVWTTGGMFLPDEEFAGHLL